MNFKNIVGGLVVSVLVVGCGSNDTQPMATVDAACGTCAQPDMTMAGPVLDFSVPMVSDGSKSAAFDIILPKSSSEHASDIDGNGTNDNRLGAIVQALATLGFNPQSPTSVAVLSGQTLLLFTEQSSDPLLQNAPDATVWLNAGTPPAVPPLYDGTDHFTVDNNITPATFTGAIASGVFNSTSPAQSTTPVTFVLKLALVANQAPLAVPITAAHLRFTRTGNKLTGDLHGAIKKTDMDAVVLPAVATMLTSQISQSAAIGMFDTNKDGVITADELKSNFLIANLLAPDVQMFKNGVYMPTAGGVDKDCLSFGMGFQAVGASF